MSSGPASGQVGARTNWTSFYPFEPYLGGLGASITAGTSSSAVALQGIFGSSENVNVAVIVNVGEVWAFVRLGDSKVTATTECMGVPPGGVVTCSLLGQGQSVPQYIAAIVASSTTTLQITTGWGN